MIKLDQTNDHQLFILSGTALFESEAEARKKYTPEKYRQAAVKNITQQKHNKTTTNNKAHRASIPDKMALIYCIDSIFLSYVLVTERYAQLQYNSRLL